jgi:hypothetical protein
MTETGEAFAPPAVPPVAPPGKVKVVELVEVYTDGGAEKTAPLHGRKQYVNLDDKVDSGTAHPEYGRIIQCKARLAWVSGDAKSLAGEKVYWYCKAGGGNKAGLTGNELEGYDAPGGAKQKMTTTDDKGWTPIVKFHLSLYGGDTFEICATEDAGYAGGRMSGPYAVWRRFWYQVTEMKDGAGGVFDLPVGVTSAFEAGYKTVFMEYEEKTPRNQADHKDNLPSGADRKTEAMKYFSADAHSPFKCHIMTIDYAQTDTELKDLEDTLTGLSWTAPSWLLLWKFGGTLPWKVTAQYMPSGGSWMNIPHSCISVSTLSTQPGFKRIALDFSKLVPAPATPIKIKLQVKVAGPGVALGWGGGSHHLYLCTGALRDVNVGAGWDPMQRSDAVHEIGHALGLVNMPPAPAHAHDGWEDAAHSHHCNKPPTLCAMWWQSSTTRLTTFHSDCHDYLRRQDFARSVMKNQWKD